MIPTLPLLLIIITAVAFQPESAGLRRVFEDNLARRRAEFGAADARTAQAARDLGLFLLKEGDRPAARRALAETLRLDEAALGRSAPQTLEDAATLAGISAAAQAEPLWRRAADATDASVAGPALTSLAAVRKSAGDLAGAATLYRRAVEKAEAMEGRDSPLVALILTQLALVAPAEEAVAALRRAVAIDQRALGPQNAQTVAAARALAALQARVKASGH